jgi:SanA protein
MAMRKKRIFKIAVVLAAFVLLTIIVCNKWVTVAAKGKLYSNENDIPYNKTGLLLGTSKFTVSGRNNPFYDNRIQAAVTLIQHGKIKYLIISGDNGRAEYNEPEAMRADLIKAGIDSTIIYLDYAGFRTFDSIKRLKEIFSQDSVTIISQQFHNERALYIASKENMHAIGFNAKDVSNRAGFKTMLREKLARVKVILDFWMGTTPKYLGSKVQLPAW